MKRFLTTIILCIACIPAFCKPPHLACETIFDRKDLRVPGNKIICTRSENNYFRSITSSNNPSLAKTIRNLVKKDQSRAYNTVEGYEKNRDYIILNILNNNEIINIGVWWDDAGYINMFIQGTMKAFE